MVLKFKQIHRKKNPDPNAFILHLKNSNSQLVTHGRNHFVQIKCDTPGEFKNFTDFLRKYVGDVTTTNRYIYIPAEWVYTDKETMFGEDDDDSLFEGQKTVFQHYIKEDFIEDIDAGDMEDSIDDDAKEPVINPKNWDYCFHFQVSRGNQEKLAQRVKQHLEHLFLHYVEDFRIDEYPWTEARQFNKNEFESPYAITENGYTDKERTRCIFVQFNPKETVKTWFIVSLINVLYNDFDGQIGSLILKFCKSDGKQFINMYDYSWGNKNDARNNLINHYCLRLGEALADYKHFVTGSRKGFKDLCGAVSYMRLCMGEPYSDEIVIQTTDDMKEILKKIG